MDNTDPTFLIMLSEIIALESIIIIGTLVIFFIKKKKSTNKLKVILSDYEKNTPERRSSLKETFSIALTSENADDVIDDLLKHEAVFFKDMLNTINKNDISKMQQLANMIHDLVGPYAKLIPNENSGQIDHEKNDPVVPDIDSVIDDLLSDEADDAEGDPALDLSEEIGPKDKIEEIPEGLLSENSTDSTDSTDSGHSDDENRNTDDTK